jgi:large subunit ribosomal protein L19
VLACVGRRLWVASCTRPLRERFSTVVYAEAEKEPSESTGPNISMNSVIKKLEDRVLRSDLPSFRVGDTVRLQVKVREGEKERIQSFEGVVIRINRGGNRATFTVRKVSYGVGVERIFPVHSQRLEKIQVLSHGRVRRARLYYLRKRQGKAARLDTISHE